MNQPLPSTPSLSAAGPYALPGLAAEVHLRSQVVEQVMRVCDDDLTVLPFLEVPPASTAAASALGRLLMESPVRLVAGCPLIALVAGTAIDPHWRDAYPPRPDSLYQHLEFLTSLYGAVDWLDPFAALEHLRRIALDDLDGLDGLDGLD